ncbi:MAG: CopG family transcriptional regulator [Giesbergeria sp.]|jgi:Arc/MetJ-type ribon-helix-helix transcriptional regulator|nr:CopG family transcriptional regulator [Simplicispira sp.]MBP6119278.1 CopG family transcriptional regulator [Giesbergeria sp.]MBP6159790.1 CopG family transcriptional regulator [Giesbergeria sp.]MBP7083484.1 CopG family transcriptional regulator [Giesbergeria sp.]MBP9783899.1 CopG family transcriptional regulator [Giesbergeria sp.]
MTLIAPTAPAKVRTPETEKVTINLGFVDLGHIDLLVAEGFYGNRTDFIRTAIRNQLAAQQEAVRQVVSRKSLVLGLQRLTRAELEATQRAGESLDVRVLGLATVDDDVSPELALATIASITVLGAFHASPAIKLALRGRIH